MDQWEREEEQLANDLNAGFLTLAEYNKQLRELQREARLDHLAAAEEAAEAAYRDVMGW